MGHQIHKVCSVAIIDAYTLKILFEDNFEQTIDFEPVLWGDIYGPLKDRALFEKVQIDREVHTLIWPNGADFDPETLYAWPSLVKALTARAKQWGAAA